MYRAEREVLLHKVIYKDYIGRKDNPICALVDNFWYQTMIDLYSPYLKNQKNYTLLDLGAGTCLFFELLKNKPEVRYTGMDNSREMLNFAHFVYGNYSNFKAVEKNLDQAFVSSENFDVYAVRSLIHHLENKDIFMDSFLNHIPSGSLVVISEPNRNIISHFLREQLKKFKKDHFDNDHEDMSVKYFLEKFNRDNIELLKIEYFGFLSYPFSFPYILKLPISLTLIRLFIKLDRWIAKIPVIQKFSWHVIYLVRKK